MPDIPPAPDFAMPPISFSPMGTLSMPFIVPADIFVAPAGMSVPMRPLPIIDIRSDIGRIALPMAGVADAGLD